MSADALVLVEPGAHRPGGHRHHTLTALATAHGRTLVVAPSGIVDDTRAVLEAAGAQVTGPRGVAAVVLALAGSAAAVLARATQRGFASHGWPTVLRRVPHQVALLARCLTEAACVRTGHRLAGRRATVVVLSASEALHGAAAVLGGRHTRFVHERVTTEDAVLRALGRLARRGERRVRVLTPTEAVRTDLLARFPRLPVQVRPFAVADERNRLTEAERRRAREAFGIPASETAVCLVGGWWPYKDLDVIDAALARLDVPVHVLVTGGPLDPERLNAWDRLPHVRLHVRPGPVPEAMVRTVYAAADAALVTRRPGTAKESGLVVDAVRMGVSLVVSGHDPHLSLRLAGQPWTRLFPPGDAAALATILSALASAPLPRPAGRAAADLGVPTPVDQTVFLTSPKELPCPSRLR
ncbi:hypothetical protein [Streptomyces sp. NPDC004579]|uniref:hypothetical protein n=1 Tax=Streptomyces sp. NPDC004579 TaxID=3154667 RepID=UPI0033A2E02A